MSDVVPRAAEGRAPSWRPLAADDRRVLGVLVEKAKTTPDAYPMSVNALRSGCNQKNNRYPLMELEIEDVEESLARLRSLGAVAEVQGGGRVSRYRHYMYEWLGVEKLELAVMAELLLRGAQTEGELRGHAARMDPIPDLDTLRGMLVSLKGKGLVLALSPEGRGYVVTHALYEPRELEKLRGEFAASAPARESQVRRNAAPSEAPRAVENPANQPAEDSAAVPRTSDSRATPTVESFASQQSVDLLRRELEALRSELAETRKSLDELWGNFR